MCGTEEAQLKLDDSRPPHADAHSIGANEVSLSTSCPAAKIPLRLEGDPQHLLD